jgi:hypothetical protein
LEPYGYFDFVVFQITMLKIRDTQSELNGNNIDGRELKVG